VLHKDAGLQPSLYIKSCRRHGLLFSSIASNRLWLFCTLCLQCCVVNSSLRFAGVATFRVMLTDIADDYDTELLRSSAAACFLDVACASFIVAHCRRLVMCFQIILNIRFEFQYMPCAHSSHFLLCVLSMYTTCLSTLSFLLC